MSASTRESLRRFAWRLDTPAGLVAMFAAALGLRLLIAPYVGFYGDLRLFRLWAGLLDHVGTHRFYDQGQFADYPPGYLYILWITGKISAGPGYLLLKLPAILADLGLAWIAGTFAARLSPAGLRERYPVRALVAAGVLFNPAVIVLSAVWGQVDAVPAMLVLWSLLLLYTGRQSLARELAAFLLFAAAIAMKPQAGFVLPVMLYALYRRYLHRRTRDQLVDGVLSICVIGALSLGLWAVSGLPFGLGPVSLLRFYRHSASVYPVTSANALNFWGAIGFWRNDSMGAHVLRIAGVSALHVGFLLFLAGVGVVLWRLHRAIERGGAEPLALAVGSAAVSLLAYTFLTRMHERYMFLSLACLAPVVVVRPLRLAYAALSGLFLLGLWYPFAYFNVGWHVQGFHYRPWFGLLLGGFATDTWQKRVWSLGVVAIAVAVVWAGFDALERDDAEREPVGRKLRRLLTVETVEPEDGSRWTAFSVVGLACVFGLVALRGELKAAPNLNDSAFHMQMVRWAGGQIREGRIPLDGWFPDLSLGSSFFHHYQSLSETLTAYAAYVTGASDQTAYLWIQYLLLALWPISVYLGARLLDLGRWPAAAAAAVSPLIVSAPGYGYEHGSYTWQGYGVFSQLWAMWLLPLAWGLTWRAVTRGKGYAAAAAALALTMALHFITGYLALLTVVVWVLVPGRAGFVRRVGRAAVVAGGALLVAAWVLVPLVGDTKWTTQSEFYRGTFFNDSYGAGKVLGWLFRAQLFDAHRFPIVTLLFAAGVAVCAAWARRDLAARALLGAFTLSLLLFFGRPTWGRLLNLLPGFRDVQIHRFVIGVHLAGILLAGVGLSWLVRAAGAQARRRPELRRPAVVGVAGVALCIVVLAPAWTERAHYDERGADSIQAQRAVDGTDGRDLDRLVSIVKARGGGRVYAGERGNWGLQYDVGAVPVHVWLADRDADAIGFTFRTIASLSTDVEARFDEANPAQYQMLDVRYLILPSDRKPPVRAKLVASSGRHRLWEVPTSGYFQVVDRAAPVTANRTDLEAATRQWRSTDLASRAIYPGVGFAGSAGPPATFSGAAPPPGLPGTVVAQSTRLQDGVATATVRAARPAVVLLKASFDPRWKATVDGRRAKPVMMAPSLVGVGVPAGTHTVRFRYAPYSHYPLLIAIAVLALLGLTLVPRRAAILRHARRLAPHR